MIHEHTVCGEVTLLEVVLIINYKLAFYLFNDCLEIIMFSEVLQKNTVEEYWIAKYKSVFDVFNKIYLSLSDI